MKRILDVSRRGLNYLQDWVVEFNGFFLPRAPKAEIARDGKIRYGCALWLLGLPLPIIILALFYRGCDW